MTDFRALCVELLLALEGEGYTHWTHSPDEDDLVLCARAALTEPEPEGPTVMQIIELSDEIEAAGLGQVDFARAVLARWGTPNFAETRSSLGDAPQPVPVSERLPAPEDCDAEHYCWRWNTIGGLWAIQPLARRWYEFESHWLPYFSLPLPCQK